MQCVDAEDGHIVNAFLYGSLFALLSNVEYEEIESHCRRSTDIDENDSTHRDHQQVPVKWIRVLFDVLHALLTSPLLSNETLQKTPRTGHGYSRTS